MRYMPVRFPGCLTGMEDCAIAGQFLPLAALKTRGISASSGSGERLKGGAAKRTFFKGHIVRYDILTDRAYLNLHIVKDLLILI